MFNIGDEVKLKKYEGYGDYVAHENQIATVCDNMDGLFAAGFHLSIMWADGEISNAMRENLEKVNQEWDEANNEIKG